jgi:hypothetical protein
MGVTPSLVLSWERPSDLEETKEAHVDRVEKAEKTRGG